MVMGSQTQGFTWCICKGSGRVWPFPLSHYQLLQPNNSKQHEMRISRSMGDIMGSLYKDSERTRKYSTGQWNAMFCGVFCAITSWTHHPLSLPYDNPVAAVTLMSPISSSVLLLLLLSLRKRLCRLHRLCWAESHVRHESWEEQGSWGVIWGGKRSDKNL